MPIITYHSVHPDWGSPLAVPPKLFSRHCAWLARRRSIVSAGRAAELLDRAGRLPRGTAAVTFDDGYADLHAHALPVLARHRIPATVFIVTSTLAERKPLDWLDEPAPEGVTTLTAEQILEMQEAGVEFGSHSHNHLDLTGLSPSECERDLRTSRARLEDLLSRRVALLGYPRGLHHEGVRRAARRAGFDYAFGTSKALAPLGPLAIPRTGIYHDDRVATLALKTTSIYPALKRAVGRS